MGFTNYLSLFKDYAPVYSHATSSHYMLWNKIRAIQADIAKLLHNIQSGFTSGKQHKSRVYSSIFGGECRYNAYVA